MADDEFTTIASFVPYGQYIAKAYELIVSFYNFGKKDEVAKAIEEIQNRLTQIEKELDELTNQVSELNARVAQAENLARIRAVREISDVISGLAFDLTRSPDAHELASIANAAGLRILTLLDDADMWLWSDVRTETSTNNQGKPETKLVLVAPSFKVMPLPLLAAAVAVFATAMSEHVRKEPSAREAYKTNLDRFYSAVTVRQEWADNDESTAPVTLPELIRAQISVLLHASTTYPENGQCRFWLECVDGIQRTRTKVGEHAIWMEDEGPHTMCTFSPYLALSTEASIIETYPPLQTLAVLAEMLHRLRTTGSLLDREQHRFPDETFHQLNLYAADHAGLLWQFTCSTSTRLANPPVWEQSIVVGTGWDTFSGIVAGYHNVLYAIKNDGSILWYRHDRTTQDAANWSGPITVAQPRLIIGLPVSHYVSGSTGTMYLVGRNLLGGGKDIIKRVTTYLAVQHHPGYRTGTGEFSESTTLAYDWSEYKSVFGGGSSGAGDVIYGLTEDGNLFWHQAIASTENGEAKWQLTGPKLIGWGWDMYTRVFSAGHGFLCGVLPNGNMNIYHFRTWRNPDATGGGHPWIGPVPIQGPNWNGLARIIPVLDYQDSKLN